MSYLKAAMGTLALVIVGLFAFVFFTFDTDYQYEQALEAFEKGKWEEVNQCLTIPLESKRSVRALLYSAYLQREKGQIELSTDLLEQAYQACHSGTPRFVKTEILLNQSLNAFLQEDFQDLESTTQQAQNLAKQPIYLSLLQGIIALKQERYEEALNLWEEEEKRQMSAKEESISPWMQASFPKYFGDLWRAQVRARAHLGLGDYLSARRTLEKECGIGRSDQDLEEAHFLIGLSYIKEGQERPVGARTSYLKLALNYFDKVPVHQERFKEDRQEVIEQFVLESGELIASDSLEGFETYTRALQQWGAQEEIDQLGKALYSATKDAVKAENWEAVRELGSVFKQSFNDAAQQLEFEETLMAHLDKQLFSASLDELIAFWEMIRSLSTESRSLNERYAKRLRSQILSSLGKDQLSIERLEVNLAFWSLLEPDMGARLSFSGDLLKAATRLWMRAQREEQAMKVMCLAADIPVSMDKEKFTSKLENSFKTILKRASENNAVDKLARLYEAMAFFNIRLENIHDPSETENELADARYLIEKGSLVQAEQRLRLILTVDPERRDARRLQGLIKVKLKEYEAAIPLLKPFSQSDAEVQQALGMSLALTGQTEEGISYLEKSRKQHSLPETVLFDTGLALLLQKEFSAASWCLTQCRKAQWETATGLLISSYYLEDWKLVKQAYSQLKAPQNQWIGVRLMLVKSLAELGELELAEDVLASCLEVSEEVKKASPLPMSPTMAQIKTTLIDKQNPLYLAGVFYRDYLKDYQAALRTFQELCTQTPESLLAEGETLLLLGKKSTACAPLEEVLTGDECKEKQRARLLLAHLYQELNQPYRSDRQFRDYFSHSPIDEGFRITHARLLMSIGCWDRAAEHLRYLKIRDQLAVGYLPYYIQSLVRSGQSKRAKNLLEEFVKESTELTENQRVKWVYTAFLTGGEPYMQELVKPLTKPSAPSPSVKLDYLALAIARADYIEAQKWVSDHMDDLQRSPQGLMQLATLESRLSNQEQALSYAYQALEKQATYVEALDFLLTYEQDWRRCEARLNQLSQLLESKEVDAQLSLLYNKQLLLFVKEKAQAGEMEAEGAEVLIAEVLQKSEELLQLYTDYPEPYYLKGLALDLQGRHKHARDAFEQALTKDRSHKGALVGIAHSYAQLGEKKEAKKALKRALTYHFDDPQFHAQLGLLYQETSDWAEARDYLEQAIKYYPKDRTLLMQMGRVSMRTQSMEMARVYFRKLIEMNPNDEEAYSLLLSCLYNEMKSTSLTADSEDHLKEEREETYRKLHSLNPQLAEHSFFELETTESQE